MSGSLTDARRAPEQVAGGGPGPRALLVEDVAVNRELVRLMLESIGYVVDEAEDGEEALRAVQETPYAVVLMDMQMPVMDGIEATRAIRALGGAHAALPIIGLSANVIADHVARCMAAGMSAHLAKPFKPRDLRLTLELWAGRAPRPSNRTLSAVVAQTGWPRVSKLLRLLLNEVEAFQRCDPSDGEALRRQAHALRGASGMLGFSEMSRLCRDLEDALRLARPIDELIVAARRAADVLESDIGEALKNGG